MTFGERLAYFRKEKGLSQRRVAERLGYASQTVFKYERDMIPNISLQVVEKIAEALEIPPAVLCGWETGDDIRLKNAINKLNDSGKSRVVEYAEDLVASERYTKSDSMSKVVG